MLQQTEVDLSEIEGMLVEMWEGVLKLEGIEKHEDFFELGGDSIAAVRFTNMLQERLGEVVQVTVLYEKPTVARLAEYLAESYHEAVAALFGRQPARADGPDAPALTEDDVRYVGEKYAALYRFPADGREGEGREARKNPPAVFVLCTPRSGSTLLRVMLAGHRDLFAPPELLLLPFRTLGQRRERFFGDRSVWSEGIIRALMEMRGCDGARAKEILAECESRDMSVREFYGLMQAGLGGRMLVDKSPSYSRSADVMRNAEEYFDGALYIHLIRHPGAMVNSYERQRLDQLSLSENFGYSPRQLAELIWIVSHRNMNAFLSEVPEERRCRVYFEELVREPRGVMEQVCARLGLEFDEEVLTPHRNQRAKMTDGPHPLSRMLGDAKFHTFKSIEPGVADSWRQAERPITLSDMALRMAEEFGY